MNRLPAFSLLSFLLIGSSASPASEPVPTVQPEAAEIQGALLRNLGPSPRPGQTPEATVRALYGSEAFLHQRGWFPRELIDHLQGCFTPSLSHHLHDFHAALEAWKVQHEGENLKLPLTEGSIFISTYEGCDRYKIGQAIITGDTARVPVVLGHTESGILYPWTDIAILHRIGQDWLLDDIAFDPARGSSGSLRLRLTPDFE